ncbi:sensor histidine kinase KdpD [Geobacter sp. DSM 9736]|uniref:sensor histidine kinase n=1 Tax=Geobacter sp. DSM 9736 TaxID=1277350 RepID=UPI000B505CBA|nr:ATP-binding protein [Geobacter sp. DSM 9736]SNB46725.1 hypothetical protein SAMN06269301_2195 [Geobacter sp. DSM 9736]
MKYADAASQTRFAPPDRTPLRLVREAREKVLLSPAFVATLEAFPDYVLVLNKERQIVAANSLVLRAFNLEDIEQIIGKRPGEAAGCVFASEGPAGCGTGDHCSTCGAVASILESQKSCSRTAFECRLTLNRERPVSLDLKVIATPTVVDGVPLTICVLKDISAEKRRSVLERVFFHDVINTAGGIHGIASMLAEHAEMDVDREAEYKQWMITLTETLIDEINHQRKLLAAERGEFKPVLGLVIVPDLLRDLHALYAHHDIAEGRSLLLGEVPDCKIISDSAILRRILGNLLKNALEATPRGGTVTISGKDLEEHVGFTIHNPGEMPREVQLQLFQRSFSTKEQTGRGIGTYSVKLFGERYLNGKIEFESNEPAGTTFTFTLPKIALAAADL